MKKQSLFFALTFTCMLLFAETPTNKSFTSEKVEAYKNFISKGITQFQVDTFIKLNTLITFKDEQKNIGSIVGYPQSQFYLKTEDNKISGFIILNTTSKEAYKIESNEKQEVLFTSVSSDQLICLEFGLVNNNNIDFKQLQLKETQSKTSRESYRAPTNLNSLPGASYVIMLDFDGYNLPAGTAWNGGKSLTLVPPTFTNSQFTSIWNIISNDYAPYQVNVTTDETVFNAAALGKKIRCVFTTTSSWLTPTPGGAAFPGSFSWKTGEPCFQFTDQVMNLYQFSAEGASHEIGHTLGLSHDGTKTAGYYYGHYPWGSYNGYCLRNGGWSF